MKKLLFLLFFLVSCGDPISSNNELATQAEDERFPVTSFSTRLSNALLVSGEPCKGGEEASRNGRVFFCAEGQWLMTVDNINSCTPEGCTEIFVAPFIASLVTLSGTESTLFLRVVPVMDVSDAVQNVLDQVLVRARGFNDVSVVFR